MINHQLIIDSPIMTTWLDMPPTLNQLKGQIEKRPMPRWMRSQELTREITGVKRPSDEEVETALGPETYICYKQLCKLSRFDFDHEVVPDVRGATEVTAELINRAKVYVELMKTETHLIETMIMILEKTLAEKEKPLQDSLHEEKRKKMEEINRLVSDADDYENSKDYVAYELFSDGAILGTQGGDLYRMCSTFTALPPLSCYPPVYKFPRKRGEYTYAILLKSDALRFREMMKKVE